MTDTASGGPSSGTTRSEAFLKGATSPPQPASFDGLNRQKRKNEVDLHRRVGNGALILMVIQLGIADAAFYFYGFFNSWHIPTAAITTWLAATVIQIVNRPGFLGDAFHWGLNSA
ncbi:MAG: hypothetical protein WDZ46_02935, partial [Solirubrobacterales bacterium]